MLRRDTGLRRLGLKCIAVVAVVGVLAALASCGGGDETETPDDVAVRNLADEFMAGSRSACENLTAAFLNREFGGSKAKCRANMKYNAVDNSVRVRQTAITGDKATVTIGVRRERAAIEFRRDGEDWRITGLRFVEADKQ